MSVSVHKLLLLAALLGLGTSSQAQLLCGSPTCVVSTGGLSFGASYDPFAVLPDDSATATITVECTATALLQLCIVPYEVSIDTGGAGGYSPREMTAGAEVLQYNVYTDPTRLLVWGDGISSGTLTVSGVLSYPILFGGTQSADHQAYGRIFAGQLVDSGSYSDSLTITVSY